MCGINVCHYVHIQSLSSSKLAFLCRLRGFCEELEEEDLDCRLFYSLSLGGDLSLSGLSTLSALGDFLFFWELRELDEEPSESESEPDPESDEESDELEDEEEDSLWFASSLNYSYFFSSSISFGALERKFRRSSVKAPRPIEVK